jgi:hypothetical protein
MTPDPYRGSVSIKRPQSWNRYGYVLNDPANRKDPSGLCAAILAGITMEPYESKALDDLQIQLGAVAGFPYNDLSASGSIMNVASQGLIGPNDSTAVALSALQAALAGTNGSIDVIAYSGGAQAFSTAYSQLSSADQARIGSILYISPGAVGTLVTTKDPSKTSVVMGKGAADVGATAFTTIPLGVSTTWTACAHTDLACLLSAAQQQITQFAAGGPCAKQDIFQRTVDPDKLLYEKYPGERSAFDWLFWGYGGMNLDEEDFEYDFDL